MDERRQAVASERADERRVDGTVIDEEAVDVRAAGDFVEEVSERPRPEAVEMFDEPLPSEAAGSLSRRLRWVVRSDRMAGIQRQPTDTRPVTTPRQGRHRAFGCAHGSRHVAE
ncbi:MAG: hypothetical protein U1E66_08100 [Rhodospirillales bacterium]